jgi:death-on-curing protein
MMKIQAGFYVFSVNLSWSLFEDGNKRTAFASAIMFLRRNGILIRYSTEHEELTVQAAKGSLDVWQIAEALKSAS